ncbi:MAG: ATP synthase F1 subunit epsilon [Pseudanabaenaceae cyanobacterium]
MSITVRVISPAEIILETTAEEVILPSITGQLGILPNHVPLLTGLDIGVLRYFANREWNAIAVNGGFAEVEDNEVTVLVKSATHPKDIDPETTRKELEEAEALLAKVWETDKQAKIQAETAIKVARAKLQAVSPTFLTAQ